MLVNINPVLIESLNNRDQIRDLSGFLFFKYFYSKSVIYNYTAKSLSKKFNLSITLIKRYVAIFEKNGWLIRQGNNLRFKRMTIVDETKLKKRYYIDITGKSISEISDLLYLQLLRFKQAQHDFIKKVQNDLHNPVKSKFFAKTKRLARKYGISNVIGESSVFINISMRKLGDFLNLSKSSVSLLIKRLNLKGLIKVLSNTKQVDFSKCKKYVKARLEADGKLFCYDGRIYRTECNSYFF